MMRDKEIKLADSIWKKLTAKRLNREKYKFEYGRN
jgi:hypothetical protein